MDSVTLIIVCPLVFLAGLVDSIAGGGGLISLTSYLIAGLPAHAALGTNKLSSAIGTIVATARMAKGGYIKLRLAVPAALGALAGSAIGAKLAMLTPDNVFEMLLIVALPFVAFAVLRKRAIDVPDDASISPRKQYAVVAVVSILIGAYDGFYGPGTGTFMLIAFTAAAKLPVKEASGEVKVANLASKHRRAHHVPHAWRCVGRIGFDGSRIQHRRQLSWRGNGHERRNENRKAHRHRGARTAFCKSAV